MTNREHCAMQSAAGLVRQECESYRRGLANDERNLDDMIESLGEMYNADPESIEHGIHEINQLRDRIEIKRRVLEIMESEYIEAKYE